MNPKRENHVVRGFRRRSANADVTVTVHKNGPMNVGPAVTAVTLDLSEAGARLLVRVPLEVGQEVVLALEGPSYRGPLSRHGKVVWSFRVSKRCCVVGVRFEEQIGTDVIQQVTIPPGQREY
jgi:hypothetical protein